MITSHARRLLACSVCFGLLRAETPPKEAEAPASSPAAAPMPLPLPASGAGAPGTVRTDVAVTLTGDGTGGTRLRYDADAEIGGVIAGVGQRMLTAVAKKTAGEFFAAVDDVLTGATPVAVDAASPGAESAGRTFVAPVPAGRTPNGFLSGAIVGGAIAIAGVLVGRLLGRRP